MVETCEWFAGIAPRPGQIGVALLSAGDDPFRHFTVPLAAPARGAARILAADRAAAAVVERVELFGAPAGAAVLGYIPRPRGGMVPLHINETGALIRLHWLARGWPLIEVSPLWLARFVSEAAEGHAAEVYTLLDAGRGHAWAAALAHVARCAARPECYAPWRAELAAALRTHFGS